MPKSNLEEKEERKFFIELARSKVSAVKAYNKYFGSVNELRELDFAVIDDYFAQEDSLDDKIAELAKLSHVAKKDKDADEVKRLKAEIKKYSDERKEVRNLSKAEMDKHAQFNRAAKPYVDAKKVLTQYENFQHLDEIAAQYDEAKARAEAEEKAKELGVKPMATWVAGALGGVDPSIMGIGPVASTKKVMAKTGLKIEDFDIIEANEAFAAQSVAVAKDLGFDVDKQVNPNGGAIALGHPVGASGCRILVTLLHEMQAKGAKTGLATLCIGGGMGCSTVVKIED